MNSFSILIKSINKLNEVDVAGIYSRLSHDDAESDSSIQKELDKRYITPTPGPHPDMSIALIWFNDELVGWVGTRLWPETFKGRRAAAQTVECFVAPEHRRKGLARLGLQALVSAGYINKAELVAVYAPEVIKLARSCGCLIVTFCEAT